jgi:hypothetical protein
MTWARDKHLAQQISVEDVTDRWRDPVTCKANEHTANVSLRGFAKRYGRKRALGDKRQTEAFSNTEAALTSKRNSGATAARLVVPLNFALCRFKVIEIRFAP